MGNEIANEVLAFITSIISMIPQPVLFGLVALIVVIVCAYESKRAAERAAEEARQRRSRVPGKKDNNGTLS